MVENTPKITDQFFDNHDENQRTYLLILFQNIYDIKHIVAKRKSNNNILRDTDLKTSIIFFNKNVFFYRFFA